MILEGIFETCLAKCHFSTWVVLRASQVALVVKNLPANAGDSGSIPGSGRPLEEMRKPLQDSCRDLQIVEHLNNRRLNPGIYKHTKIQQKSHIQHCLIYSVMWGKVTPLIHWVSFFAFSNLSIQQTFPLSTPCQNFYFHHFNTNISEIFCIFFCLLHKEDWV